METQKHHKYKSNLTKKLFNEKNAANFFSLTPTSLYALKQLAEDLDINESFAAEMIIRCGLNDAKRFYKKNGFKPEKKRDKSLTRYGEKKKSKNLCLTMEAINLLDIVGEELNDSASEVLEWAIRAGLEPAKRYIVNTLNDVKLMC